ncbi:MAG: hypothetical protein ABIO86_04745 [Sphingomonas sp.]
MNNEMRRLLAISSIWLAIPPWMGALLITPYMRFDDWGSSATLKRPHVAHLVFGFEAVSVALLLAACFLIFQVKANRQSWRSWAFAFAVVLMIGTAVARVVYAWSRVFG